MKEMGGEFWEIEQCCNPSCWWNNYPGEIRYYMSGRTAIDAVVKDIKLATNKTKFKVCLPKYCCDSMVFPFSNQGIEIGYYDSIETVKNNFDVILVLEYFGFQKESFDECIRNLKANGKIVIQDVTHSLLQERPYVDEANYIIGSFRKWTRMTNGGFAAKRGEFCYPQEIGVNTDFSKKRIDAANLKFRYMHGETIQKSTFLEGFKLAEEYLETKYIGYCMDQESIDAINQWDISYVIDKRRENAHYLYNNLKNVNFMYEFSSGSTPLFVPILFDDSLKRDSIRQYLISKDIYCPVHWPNAYPICDLELSLICDQRYSLEDMKYEVELINNFLEGS